MLLLRMCKTVLQLLQTVMLLQLLLQVLSAHFTDLPDGLRVRKAVFCSFALELTSHILQLPFQFLSSLLHLELNINLQTAASTSCRHQLNNWAVNPAVPSEAVSRGLSLLHSLCFSCAGGCVRMLQAAAFAGA